MRRIFLVILLFFGSTGCAIHYFDKETGTEHLWGIGHMAMKPSVQDAKVKAVGLRTDVVGISTGYLQEGIHFELGWGGRQRIEILDDNTQFYLGWPTGRSFYTARVGSSLPPELGECGVQKKEDTR